jgi:hypothetical protein
MIDIGVAPGIGAVVTLLGTSLCAFVTGVVFRKWPAEVQAYVETLDGSTWLMRPEKYRSLIAMSGTALIALSFVALLAAGYLLR